MKQRLRPMLADVRLECVLMQAWKKASSYLRYHSWYADTLGVDFQSLRIPQFLAEIRESLQHPDEWRAAPLDMVPAPKTQRWGFKNDTWCPLESGIDVRMRPLAHVALRDQVVATALMVCLADRLETALGDPRLPVTEEGNRRRVLAYGHRLFCDRSRHQLQHRWGSTKLYRQYFQDYQTFLERPKAVAGQLSEIDSTREVAIVQSDLSKFYDRVRPEMLHEKLMRLRREDDDPAFFDLAQRLLDWRWSDHARAAKYAKLHGIEGFDRVALPQGLVAAGFFANVALCDFDAALRESIGKPIDAANSFILHDVCYYVDDLRLVVQIPGDTPEAGVQQAVVAWLQSLLDQGAPGLMVEDGKTSVTVEGRERRFLVPQSRAARRIQREVSGAFDMLHGTELIGAIEGFFHTQQRYSSSELTPTGRTGLLIGTSDMRDDTAARFAAGRFRRTFRSLRPLLAAEAMEQEPSEAEEEEEAPVVPSQLVLSKQQLDERAKLFAALLIEEWTADPANIRLLRIAFDMYPDDEFLEQVLIVLRPGWQPQGVRGARREVRTYCLAELFRAGATETGLVYDDECLPGGVSAAAYHERLVKEALAILAEFLGSAAPTTRYPWYLMQQLFLYLGARNAFPPDIAAMGARGGQRLSHYRQFAKFLTGQPLSALEERALFFVIAQTGFGVADVAQRLAQTRVSAEFLTRVNQVTPSVASDLWAACSDTASVSLSKVAKRLGLENHAPDGGDNTLASVAGQADNPFFREENLLALAYWLLQQPSETFTQPITPWQLRCVRPDANAPQGDDRTLGSWEVIRGGSAASQLFAPPDWCESNEERQKIQTGLLLRFALRGTTGFFVNYSLQGSSPTPRYRKPLSHWEQQRYSGFQGRAAFGPPWLPISSFVEELLFELLRWPGAGVSAASKSIAALRENVDTRLGTLRAQQGIHSSLQFLEQRAPLPYKPRTATWSRPLRVGIVQSVIPDLDDYTDHMSDPTLENDGPFRSRQRAHLAALMEGVSQMLSVRETHRTQQRTDGLVIDLLVFPELAVHPDDVRTLLKPFVRQKKCMTLCGLVYHPQTPDAQSPLINSCMWLIPEWSKSAGFQIREKEQGKQHLTQSELSMNPCPVSFRPAQWLVEYEWNGGTATSRPLVLTASICYDATDLTLAADLRGRSDLYLVCALNKDVGTFDRMSEGLHYHMFQGVVVVNNGQFGGSSCFLPFKKPFQRQVFHLHGQPQASVAFVEIDPEKLIGRPKDMPDLLPEGKWKIPPAGWLLNRENDVAVGGGDS